MSAPATLFGCIFGGNFYAFSKPNWQDQYAHNKNMVDMLPDEVDYKNRVLLTRRTFSVPMMDGSAGFYRHQMIHFGASYNHFCGYWSSWLNQFEDLLRKLYWYEAVLYLEAEGCCALPVEYHWWADFEVMAEDPPRTIQEWRFEGGSRDFDYYR